MIIDFHTHTFPDSICARTVEGMSRRCGICHFTDASKAQLAASMKASHVDCSVNLPIATKLEQVEHINSRMIEHREELLADGIITFGTLHPYYTNYKSEIARLRDGGIVGIKLHPAYQETDLSDIRYKRIIEAISDAGMITLFHSGWDIGYTQHNYASVDMILEIIKDVAPERLVAAHRGGLASWHEVESRLAGAPVWFDTAYSIGTAPLRMDVPHDTALMYAQNLLPEQFVHLVRKHGSDRVLFGTDSPWQDQRHYIELMQTCGLTEDELAAVMGGNAAALLRYPLSVFCT